MKFHNLKVISYAKSQLAMLKNTIEKLLHQMEKKIIFLHKELKSKNTKITLL